MEAKFPLTIENGLGEKIIFLGLESTPEGDRVINEGYAQPGGGPPMHTHFKQDEGFTVVSGKLGYQTFGQAAKYAGPGESVVFKRGTPHRFWAEGEEPLHIKGWLQPANNIVFFLSALYAAQKKSGNHRPEKFDAAFLLTRYASEFDLVELPGFVKKVVLPITFFIGRLLGKYDHFKDAPEPVR